MDDAGGMARVQGCEWREIVVDIGRGEVWSVSVDWPHGGRDMWIVKFKDGDALNCEERSIGPFPSHDDAYEYLCGLPAPRPHGHKFVEQLQSQPADIMTDFINEARATRDTEDDQ